ncbi:MAG: F0F1 ATP synthase subunit A [Acidimicrobiia bacterium]|nr:F0F1 ATP synthase subunit A [Acidimicrobiia bacterium]
MVFSLAFPPISHLLEWPDIWFEGTFYAINKVALINIASVLLILGFLFAAGRKKALVPTGSQNATEAFVDWIRSDIVMQTMGPKGLSWTPFLTLLFMFIFVNNIAEIIPPIYMPANGRLAGPLVLALVVYVIWNFQGLKHQGFVGYFKGALFPPGLPKFLYVLVTPIEFISTFLIRPFSHTVRLFANMMAGHILLATFAILTAALWAAQPYVVLIPLPFAMLTGVLMFEIVVALLQAFIFTILAAVYIGGAINPEH